MVEDVFWMDQAIKLAHEAVKAEEVPVGAVLVRNGQLIGAGHNQPIQTNDPTAHAEIVALREGGKALGNYRLNDTTLYVTLEPCAMCVSAIIHARVKRVVFGAYDKKTGAVVSALSLLEAPHFNHQVVHEGGVKAGECGKLLSDFFKYKCRSGSRSLV